MLIDDHCIRIIECLKENPYSRFLDISKKTSIPLQKVYDLYYDMKDDGIIRNSILINYEKLNFDVHTFIYLDVRNPEDKGVMNQMQDFLESNININNISLTERGFIIEVVFVSEPDYEYFIKKLKRFDIIGLKEFFITEQLAAEKFIPRIK